MIANRIEITGARIDKHDVVGEKLLAEVQNWNSPATIQLWNEFQMVDNDKRVAVIQLNAEGAVQLRDWLNEHVVSEPRVVEKIIQVEERVDEII